MTTYKKCKKCGKDFPFEGSFRKSKKIRYLCMRCINELSAKDDDEIEEYQSSINDDLKNINWSDPKVAIITIIIIVIIFIFFVLIKRDYFSNYYPESRPIDATY